MKNIIIFLLAVGVGFSALSEVKKIDRVEVLGSGAVQVREVYQILKTSVVDSKEVTEVISQKYHRRVLAPGDKMDAELAARLSAVNTEKVAENELLKVDKAALIQEKESLQSEKEALEVLRESLIAEINALQAQLDALKEPVIEEPKEPIIVE